jgi:predicted secreted protein
VLAMIADLKKSFAATTCCQRRYVRPPTRRLLRISMKIARMRYSPNLCLSRSEDWLDSLRLLL